MNIDVHQIWFILLGALLTGYFILDGFDLGVGILHLFVKTDQDRRIVLNSIGPLWDGNEVWLVTFGGALFSAFPNAYALAFSSFYLLFMMVLCALIFRAVSIEFRSKRPWKWWRNFWDCSFAVASTSAAFLYGTMIGHMFIGLPVSASLESTSRLIDHFSPYTMLIGLFAIAACAMHGSIFLYLKTEGELQQRIHHWIWTTFGIFIIFYMLTTIFTLVNVPHATTNFAAHPWVWGVVVLNVLAIANIPRAIYMGKPAYAFISSCCTLAALTFLFGVAMYPNLIYSSPDAGHSLNIYNAASSDKTLYIMLIVAILGMPFVLSYTAVVYWIFRGKVQLGKTSY